MFFTRSVQRRKNRGSLRELLTRPVPVHVHFLMTEAFSDTLYCFFNQPIMVEELPTWVISGQQPMSVSNPSPQYVRLIYPTAVFRPATIAILPGDVSIVGARGARIPPGDYVCEIG